MQKADLRRSIKERRHHYRASLSPQEYVACDEGFCRQLAYLGEEYRARFMIYPRVVGLYAAYGDELSCAAFFTRLVAWGAKMALPRIVDDQISFHGWDEGDHLVPHPRYGIKEPMVEKPVFESIDWLIMPALAVDKSGIRLGYGGGFYDRFLAYNNNIKFKTACCYSWEVMNKLPCEPHDQAVETIATEKNVLII